MVRDPATGNSTTRGQIREVGEVDNDSNSNNIIGALKPKPRRPLCGAHYNCRSNDYASSWEHHIAEYLAPMCSCMTCGNMGLCEKCYHDLLSNAGKTRFLICNLEHAFI